MTTYVPYDEGGQAAPATGGQVQYVPYDDKPADATKTVAATQQATFMDQLKRAGGRFARMGIEGATGTGAAIGDFAHGATNAASLLATGKPLLTGPKPSEAQSQALTRMGLPEDQGVMEKITGALGRMVAGGFDPALLGAQQAANKLAPSTFASAPSPQAQQNLITKQLHDSGYVLPPTEMNAGRIPRAIEGMSDSSRIVKAAEVDNQVVTNNLAKKALNLAPTEPLTADTLQSQAQQLIKDGYDPIRQVAKVDVGAAYRKALVGIKADLGGSNSFPLAQRTEVKDLVDKYLYTGGTTPTGAPRVVQSYTGDDAINEISLLRKEASSKFAKGDGLQGEAMRRIATALEDNIESSLKGQGSKLVGTFRTTREALAKNFAVERMLTDPNTGNVNAVKAAQMLKAGTPLTGELETIAKAGGPMYSRATGVPTGGKPPMFSPWETTMMGVGAAAGKFSGLGYLPSMIPPAKLAGRSAVLSKFAQNRIANGLVDQPSASVFGDASPRVQANVMPQLFQLFQGNGEQQ